MMVARSSGPRAASRQANSAARYGKARRPCCRNVSHDSASSAALRVVRSKTTRPRRGGSWAPHLPHLLELDAVGDEQEIDLGVGKLIVDLASRQRSVRRDVDGADGEDGQVGDQPIDAVLRHHADAISRRDAVFDERGRGGERLGPILLPGHVMPQSVTLVAQSRTRAETFGLPTMQFDEIAPFMGLLSLLARFARTPRRPGALSRLGRWQSSRALQTVHSLA